MNQEATAPAFLVASVFALAGAPSAPLHAQAVGAGAYVDLNVGRDAPEAGGIVDLQRLGGPVEMDGLSFEAAWANVEPMVLTMYEPEFRGATDRRIQVLVA